MRQLGHRHAIRSNSSDCSVDSFFGEFTVCIACRCRNDHFGRDYRLPMGRVKTNVRKISEKVRELGGFGRGPALELRLLLQPPNVSGTLRVPSASGTQSVPGTFIDASRRVAYDSRMHRITRVERSVLLAVLIVAGGISGFAALADVVCAGRTRGLDEWTLRCLRRPDDPAALVGPAWMKEAVRAVTSLGGVSVLVGVNLAVAAGFAVRRKFATLAFILASVVGGLLLWLMLSSYFARPRPQIVPYLCSVTGNSFPSGHSMMSAVVYLTLAALLASRAVRRRSKLLVITAALLLAGLIGSSRVCLGVHYPSDVLAGWTAGLVWATACWLLARRLRKRALKRSDVAGGVPSASVVI
jgi:undecaprenyl-diphosphatase